MIFREENIKTEHYNVRGEEKKKIRSKLELRWKPLNRCFPPLNRCGRRKRSIKTYFVGIIFFNFPKSLSV